MRCMWLLKNKSNIALKLKKNYNLLTFYKIMFLTIKYLPRYHGVIDILNLSFQIFIFTMTEKSAFMKCE